ncbi:MAG TPA: retron Ec67 family RNA-directed DNA polymerase/endonuclease [Bryobacteraceae bacterium]|nr:retron Ec67 family RNA-directed DNA polymerase/endonuclease [Bryobacteraceae bacterium]
MYLETISRSVPGNAQGSAYPFPQEVRIRRPGSLFQCFANSADNLGRLLVRVELHDPLEALRAGDENAHAAAEGISCDPGLAQIACDDNSLPQGSPCSPVVSNLIAHIMDMQLLRLVSRAGCTYSRYTDDLTFSTNKNEFPPDIAQQDPANPHVWTPARPLVRQITRAGFRINPTKTRMQYRMSRQEVTGLVVNQKINVRTEYRREVRAMVHHLFTTGKFTLVGPVTKNGVVTLEDRDGTLDELHGRLGFIDSIDRHDGEKKQPMYRRFLLYKDFYMAARPVIICEGKTDNVYLKHAIRSLAAQFPQLATIDQQGKITLNVRLYNYPQTSTGRILGLSSGGSALIAHFIGTYKKDTDHFHAPGQKHPVIILYDNDAGAKDIRSAIGKATKNRVKGTEPYLHVARNLYAMRTPLSPGVTESKIEDFFDAATKATQVGGKTFNDDSNGFDKNQHFGKHIFAEQVVKAKASTISFAGFQPLLAILEDIIKQHAAILAGQAATVP